MTLRLFSAALAHETNETSPAPTSFESFKGGLWWRPPRPLPPELAEAAEFCMRRAAQRRGHAVVDGLHASAAPSARPVAQVYEGVRDRILADLRAAMPVDGVLLFLHGAQAAEGYDDCEGDLLAAVRTVVGPEVPIAAMLDLHGHVSARMLDATSLIAMCKEYPHTDFDVCADGLVAMVERVCRREIEPVAAFQRVPLLAIMHTTRQPMRGFIDAVREREAQAGLLSISLQHGFPFSDTPLVGAGVLVIADGDHGLALRTAEDLGADFFALREVIAAPRVGVDAAIDQALAAPRGPVVIADTSDNAGGGAGSDSTYFLRRLLERGVSDVAIGAICDPVAVDFARRAGVGAGLPLRIGGKSGSLSGDPVDVQVRVTAIEPDLVQDEFGQPTASGPFVAVSAGGIDIILCQARQQTHGHQVFTSLGVDISRCRLVVVKSAQHFHTSFAPLAADIIYACPPGVTSTDFARMDYRRAPRPVWPLDDPPFQAFGRAWPSANSVEDAT